jgi:hypothetical protein
MDPDPEHCISHKGRVYCDFNKLIVFTSKNNIQFLEQFLLKFVFFKRIGHFLPEFAFL